MTAPDNSRSSLAADPPRPRPLPAWFAPLMAGLALWLIAAFVYWPVHKCGFIWDDDAYVTQNPTLRDAAGLREIWLNPHSTPQYYPLVFTSFWFEYHLWQLRPTGYHLVNVALHGLSALLVWLILRRMKIPGAWLAAAIFALHPVHVESVAWITERKNVLSGLFYLGALWFYLDHDETGRRRPLAIALLLFVAALLSKTVTASLPVAAALLLWARGRWAWRKSISLAPFFVLGAGFGLLTAWLEKTHVGAQGAIFDLTIPQRLAVAGRALWFYLGKLVWPVGLNFNYPRWETAAGWAGWWTYPAAAAFLLVALWALRRRIGGGGRWPHIFSLPRRSFRRWDS